MSLPRVRGHAVATWHPSCPETGTTNGALPCRFRRNCASSHSRATTIVRCIWRRSSSVSPRGECRSACCLTRCATRHPPRDRFGPGWRSFRGGSLAPGVGPSRRRHRLPRMADQRVVDIVEEVMGRSYEPGERLDADSLSQAELVLALEDAFHVRLPDETSLGTVDEAQAVIESTDPRAAKRTDPLGDGIGRFQDPAIRAL